MQACIQFTWRGHFESILVVQSQNISGDCVWSGRERVSLQKDSLWGGLRWTRAFADHSEFTRRFVEATGVTPSQFRATTVV